MTRRFLPLLCVLCVCVAPLLGADWSHWRGPWQNGVSPEKNLPDKWSPRSEKTPRGENLIWSAPYGCRSTPLVLNGRVYLINYASDKVKKKNEAGEVTLEDDPQTIQERVMCLDAKNGKLVKEQRFNVFHSDIVTARLGWTDLAADPKTGQIYAHGTQGFLNCYDKDLKLLWSRQLTEEFGRGTGYGGRITSPVVAGDLVIIGMINSAWGDHAKGANRFVAFNKDNGRIVWWAQPREQIVETYYSHPIIANVKGALLVVSGTADGSIAAMKVNTGETAWTYNFSIKPINSTPVFDPKTNYVYIGSGEESPDNNVQGRVICLDASQVEKGEPKVVWQVDGIKARYASPILDGKAGRLYVPDDVGKLHCLDARTGDPIWKYSYGSTARGSPVLADGKIYVGDVNSRFLILQPGAKKCKELHSHFFPAPDGITAVEINGSPAVANGRVYFATSEEIYCIGTKDAKAATLPVDKEERAEKSLLKPTHLQVLPADITVHPGDSVVFKLRLFNERGELFAEADDAKATWSLPTPPVPPGKKTGPPALKGEIAGGKLTVDGKLPNQAGYVQANLNGLTAKARIRVAPVLPYKQDFEKIPDGAVPGGWVNTQGKFLVATFDGNKVLKKVNTSTRPPLRRGNAYIGLPTLKDYTIQCDLQGSKVGDEKRGFNMPEMGVVANRYTLLLAGNIQKLRLVSWDALPRIDKTMAYAWKPGVWYTMKLTVGAKGSEALVKGKVWERGQKEPTGWTIEVRDPRPNTEGAPALFGDVIHPGTDVYYDNVVITPNKR